MIGITWLIAFPFRVFILFPFVNMMVLGLMLYEVYIPGFKFILKADD